MLHGVLAWCGNSSGAASFGARARALLGRAQHTSSLHFSLALNKRSPTTRGAYKNARMSTARGLASQAGSRWQQLPASRREGECSSMQRVAPTPIAPTPVAATFAPRRRRSDAVSCRGDAQRVQCSLLSREPAASQTRTPGGKRQRIVILGGGLGGLYAAIRLDMLVWRGEKPEVRKWGGHVEVQLGQPGHLRRLIFAACAADHPY